MCLQHFSGLTVTLAGPMIRHSAAGHQRTQAPGGKSSPVVPQLLTLGLTWTIQVQDASHSRHIALFSSQQHALFYPTGGSGNFIYTLATGPQETKVARLVSPVVTPLDSDLCVSFWYHMFGSHIGTLHIKQRKPTIDGPADILLWTVSGHQGSRWREGRVLVPETDKPYQVSRNHSFFDFC